MADEPETPPAESVSEAVRRTLLRADDLRALEERIKERVRDSKIAALPIADQPPKSSRAWSAASSTPVGIACAPQVAAVFEKGGVNIAGAFHVPFIVDRRLSPTNTKFFYDQESWEARRVEQQAWDATHPPQPPDASPE